MVALPTEGVAVVVLTTEGVAVVVLTTEGVDVVAAHGQVESPNLRVKRSRSTDVCGYLLHFPRVGSWVCMCDLESLTILYMRCCDSKPIHTSTCSNARDHPLI